MGIRHSIRFKTIHAVILISLLLELTSSLKASAQRHDISVNLFDIADFGTLDVEGSMAFARHWAVEAGIRYNPWEFNTTSSDTQLQNKCREVSIGATLWPWHIYSGWWTSLKAQYREYNKGGISSRKTEEGDAYGISAGFGWSWMIHRNFNLNFGVEGWGGRKMYTVFACPKCGRIADSGEKWFVAPDNLKVAIEFIF